VASDHIFGVDDGYEGGSLDGNEKDKRSGQTTNCPFRRLGLDPNITKALTNPDGHFRLSQPTIVQSRAINALLPLNGGKMTGKGAKKLEENLFVQSETGSGKTLAYLLPILQVSLLSDADFVDMQGIFDLLII
jgi:ATP-dependent RNA helicase DDX31/DBP7